MSVKELGKSVKYRGKMVDVSFVVDAENSPRRFSVNMRGNEQSSVDALCTIVNGCFRDGVFERQRIYSKIQKRMAVDRRITEFILNVLSQLSWEGE